MKEVEQKKMKKNDSADCYVYVCIEDKVQRSKKQEQVIGEKREKGSYKLCKIKNK